MEMLEPCSPFPTFRLIIFGSSLRGRWILDLSQWSRDSSGINVSSWDVGTCGAATEIEAVHVGIAAEAVAAG